MADTYDIVLYYDEKLLKPCVVDVVAPPPLPAILVLLCGANLTQKGWKIETEPTPILLCHNLYLNRKNNYFMSVSQAGCIQLLTHSQLPSQIYSTPFHNFTRRKVNRFNSYNMVKSNKAHTKKKKISILTINNLSLENNTSAKSLQGINISAWSF